MSFKRTKVVMLPTEKSSDIILRTRDNVVHQRKYYGTAWEDMGDVYQQLYFLSDDEIKEHDWHYDEKDPGNEIKQWKGGLFSSRWSSRWSKKIIASTDKSLKQKIFGLGETAMCSLPEPSEGFIQKFVDAYNNGKLITEVDVEYNHLLTTFGIDEEWLKVNPKDNTITIKKIKDTYTQQEVDDLLDRNSAETTAQILKKFQGFKSREEVSKLLHSLAHDVSINNWNSFEKIDKWIEENL